MMRDRSIAAAASWSELALDPSTIRRAEAAATAAGLSVEAWLERAIRRALPNAFGPDAFRSDAFPSDSFPRVASAVTTATAAPTPLAAALNSAEIEASLSALLQRMQGATQDLEPAADAASAPLATTTPALPPMPEPMAAPVAAEDQALPELPPSLRRAVANAEAEDDAPLAPLEDLAAESDIAANRAEAEPDLSLAPAAKRRFRLWLQIKNGPAPDPEEEVAAAIPDATESSEAVPRHAGLRRVALIAAALAFAIAAGAITAQLLVPNAPDGARVATALPLAPAMTTVSAAPSAPIATPPDSSASSRVTDASAGGNAPSSAAAAAPSSAAATLVLRPSTKPDGTKPAIPSPIEQAVTAPASATPLVAGSDRLISKAPLTRLAKGSKNKPVAGMPSLASLAARPDKAAGEIPAKAETPLASATSARPQTNDKPLTNDRPLTSDSASAPGNPKALAAWLAQRAAKGDAAAQYRLGVLYALGQGVTQDYPRAAQLFKTAADHGVAEAQYNVAVMYSEGLGVTRDPNQAVSWYRKAAAQGNANAAFNLGVAYSNAVGVPQSMTDAAQWFRRAAEAGIINAQFNLGLLYERGNGVPASPVEAYAWYSTAAARGDSGAAQRRDHLAGTLSAASLKEGQARAQQLQAMISGGVPAAEAAALATATARINPSAAPPVAR